MSVVRLPRIGVVRLVPVFAVLAGTLIGCASSPPRPGADDAPSRMPARKPPGPPSPAANHPCGELPTSSGPLAGLARLVISAPATVQAGTEIGVRATVSFSRDTARTISMPSRSALLLLDGDRVIARRTGDSAAEIPLVATTRASRPAQAVPSAIRLTGCDERGAAVAPGSYRLAAVLGYRLDSLNTAVDGPARPMPAGRVFVLVSEPVPIRVG